MRGSSGARIVVHDGVVVKTMKDVYLPYEEPVRRLVHQGRWIRDHQDIPALPRIHQVLADGYTMERLVEPQGATSEILPIIIDVLQEEFWSRREEGACRGLCIPEHVKKTERLFIALSLGARRKLRNVRDTMDWAALRRCLTHGDPTLDNMMWRDFGERFEEEQVVLIDPIPPTVEVPQLMAVDYGKVLQSALGYERIRYNDNAWPGADLDHAESLLDGLSFDEQRAAWYWCAVHFLRAVPYSPNIRGELIYRAEMASSRS
jgi:hypothetical protein